MDFSAAKLIEIVQVWGLKALMAIVILIVGGLVARLLRNSLRGILCRAKVEETLVSFATNLAYALLPGHHQFLRQGNPPHRLGGGRQLP